MLRMQLLLSNFEAVEFAKSMKTCGGYLTSVLDEGERLSCSLKESTVSIQQKAEWNHDEKNLLHLPRIERFLSFQSSDLVTIPTTLF